MTARANPSITTALFAVTLFGGCSSDQGGEPNATPMPPAPATASVAASASANSFVVHGARVFDGERDLGRVPVVVVDGRIAGVGDDAAHPDGVPVVDGTGKTLLPGLIDAHVHAWGDAQRDMLRFGVTTALDMHGAVERLPALRTQREALGATDQADLWASGYAITAPRGHGTQYGFPVPTIDDDTDIDAFIGARVGEGVDYIKVIIEDLGAYRSQRALPTLSPAQVASVIDAAHARQRLAVVHVSAQRDARTAVDAGADGLVHVFVDGVADDALVAAMRERDVFIVPTLSVVAAFSGTGDGDDLLDDPALKAFISPDQRVTLTASGGGLSARQERVDSAMESIRRLHAAGVTVLAGTDAPNPGTAHGVSLHGELRRLVEAGLSPAQALAAATALPARRFGIADRGRIAPGQRADLLLVDGDPLADIRATRAIASVWKNGYAVERNPPETLVAAVIPDDTLVSDFDDGIVSARFGSWLETTDQMAGGASTVRHAIVENGASGSGGALAVSGEVRAGFGFPWSGMIFFPATQAMETADLSNRKELVFQVRGDGRRYNAMLFSGPSAQGLPSMQTFATGPEWREVRIGLDDFPGGDLALVRGIAFTAGQPLGTFEFQIDDLQIVP